ncbi:hypothetical protein BAUCODRAFT_125007 [Baudoinia panamericana UAMH 10762]|uniref:Uncharacterized protein n=1 Tax=Baudoinia panamericana (strain UAMH 10762) TaxID=717646 RepID=M2LJ92_BAUPA|nr:uncharacterized protein BAUCODRAFT_125007 [Baudoinia panamericana UAMH 10762]EMC94302.1 hypothetical protein BAUCODRAFT_125007 [Baudoinia panamericana UAMH 10762]
MFHEQTEDAEESQYVAISIVVGRHTAEGEGSKVRLICAGHLRAWSLGSWKRRGYPKAVEPYCY